MMITKATLEILDQGLDVLKKVSAEDYNTTISVAYGATIGGHYRHIIEHFTTLYNSHANEVVNYDLRERNLQIEQNLEVAIQVTEALKEKWSKLAPLSYSNKIQLQGKLAQGVDESMELDSTVGRETAYAIMHAHHHYAIIGIMCALLNNPAAEDFGVAPSTVKFREEQGEEALAVK